MIRAIRVTFLAGSIALGVASLYLSALVLAVGSVILAPWDTDE